MIKQKHKQTPVQDYTSKSKIYNVHVFFVTKQTSKKTHVAKQNKQKKTNRILHTPPAGHSFPRSTAQVESGQTQSTGQLGYGGKPVVWSPGEMANLRLFFLCF